MGLEELRQCCGHGVWLLDHEQVGGVRQGEPLGVGEPRLDGVGAVDEPGLAAFADDVEDGCGDAPGQLGGERELQDRWHLDAEEVLTRLHRLLERARHGTLEDGSSAVAADQHQESLHGGLVVAGRVRLEDRGERILIAGVVAVRRR